MKFSDAHKQIAEIFEHWQRVMNHPRAKLDSSRRRAIAARLREGYTVEQIKAAIDGCKASDFHQGKNDAGAVYDGLTLICRNAEKLDFFIALNKKAARKREPWQNAGRSAPPPAEPVKLPEFECSRCMDIGTIDACPEDPGYRPDRWQPCPNCNGQNRLKPRLGL